MVLKWTVFSFAMFATAAVDLAELIGELRGEVGGGARTARRRARTVTGGPP